MLDIGNLRILLPQNIASSLWKDVHWVNQNDGGTCIVSNCMCTCNHIILIKSVGWLDGWWCQSLPQGWHIANATLVCMQQGRDTQLKFWITGYVPPVATCCYACVCSAWLHHLYEWPPVPTPMSCMSTSSVCTVCVWHSAYTGTSILVHHYYISFIWVGSLLLINCCNLWVKGLHSHHQVLSPITIYYTWDGKWSSPHCKSNVYSQMAWMACDRECRFDAETHTFL